MNQDTFLAIQEKIHGSLKKLMQNTVTEKVDVVTTEVSEAVTGIGDTVFEEDVVLYDQCTTDNADTIAAMLEDFQGDCPEFRGILNDLVDRLEGKIPACPYGRSSRYGWIYKCLNDVIKDLTDNKKDLRGIFETEFKPVAPTMFRKSFGEYRRIQLCSSSPYWRQVTIEALKRLPREIFKYLRTQYKVNGYMNDTGKILWNN